MRGDTHARHHRAQTPLLNVFQRWIQIAQTSFGFSDGFGPINLPLLRISRLYRVSSTDNATGQKILYRF
jgi:hypothetical protein